MKEFTLFTLARCGIFIASYAVILGVWMLATGTTKVPMFWPFALAVLISALASVFLLRRQRQRFAARVQQRATRMTTNMERARSERGED